MYGYISGFTDADHVRFCPKCGASIAAIRGDGVATCDKCGYTFAVIDCKEEVDD